MLFRKKRKKPCLIKCFMEILACVNLLILLNFFPIGSTVFSWCGGPDDSKHPKVIIAVLPHQEISAQPIIEDCWTYANFPNVLFAETRVRVLLFGAKASQGKTTTKWKLRIRRTNKDTNTVLLIYIWCIYLYASHTGLVISVWGWNMNKHILDHQ